jgi:YVTN family beta-propeller protein
MRLFLALVLSVGLAAQAAAQSHTLIVLSHSNHVAYELDPESGKVLHEFTAPNQPHEATVTPDGKQIFVAVPQGPSVEVLDAESFKPIAKIESPFFSRTPVKTQQGMNSSAAPHGIAATEDGTKVYVGLENADVPGVVVIDVKSRKVARKIDLLLAGGHYLAIQPGTGKLYYPHRDDDRVVVLDTKTERILKVVPVKGGPVGVAFRPNGEVWLHEDGDGSVTVMDSKTDTVLQVIPTGGKGAGRIAVSPDGRFAASTHGGTQDVAIIDTDKRTVVASVPVGAGPGFPLFSPDSTKLYVMNSRSGDVAVIDVATRTVTARHKVGTDPFGGAVKRTTTR